VSLQSDKATLAAFGLNLPDGWSVVRIGSLLRDDRGISVGVMYPGVHDSTGVPLLRVGDMAGNLINPQPEFRVSTNKHTE
jgi:type I restriction enzyme S subunit